MRAGAHRRPAPTPDRRYDAPRHGPTLPPRVTPDARRGGPGGPVALAAGERGVRHHRSALAAAARSDRIDLSERRAGHPARLDRVRAGARVAGLLPDPAERRGSESVRPDMGPPGARD